MPTPLDDGGGGDDGDGATRDDPGAAPDPAISYPRGNRLGLRHPRPTVVIVVAVVVLLAGGFLWRLVQPATATMCELTGSIGSGPLGAPTASDPEGAFLAWYEQRSSTAKQGDELPPLESFERTGDEQWDHIIDDDELLRVEVVEDLEAPGTYRVGGANRCDYGTPEQLGVSGP